MVNILTLCDFWSKHVDILAELLIVNTESVSIIRHVTSHTPSTIPSLCHPSLLSSAHYLSAPSCHPLPEASPPVVTPSFPPCPPSGSHHYTAGASPPTSAAETEGTQTAATLLGTQGADIGGVLSTLTGASKRQGHPGWESVREIPTLKQSLVYWTWNKVLLMQEAQALRILAKGYCQGNQLRKCTDRRGHSINIWRMTEPANLRGSMRPRTVTEDSTQTHSKCLS